MESVKGAVDVGIVARDADALRRWYTDVLGIEYVESFATAVGDIHRLRFGDSWVKIAGARRSAPVAARTFEDPGVYLTFETTDVQRHWDRAIDAGAEVVLALGEFGEAGLVGTFRDPEGNLVELLNRG